MSPMMRRFNVNVDKRVVPGDGRPSREYTGTGALLNSQDINKKILVIEDSADLRELYCRALGQYSVTTASCGRSGLTLLESGYRPDLILLDLLMPEMDGSEFLSNLRKNLEFGQTKAVVISGIDELAKRAKEIGADGFVRKPVDLDLLFSEVAKQIYGSDVRV